jgi:hypothetical protein
MTEASQNVASPAKSPRPRRGCLHRLWRVFLVDLLVSIALSLIPERPLSVHVLKEERVDFSGDLLAGAAKRVITPPREMWESLNLYDEKGPIEGVADDIYARSLALGASGSPEVVSVVSMEILVIPPTMLPAVQEELARRGLKHVHVTLNASHTHAGPGNFWDLWFGGSFMGKYSPEFFAFLIARAADAVEASVEAMRPALIGIGDAPTRYVLKQRRYADPVTGLAPPVDEEVGVIRVNAKDGGAIACVVNFGAHPTTLMHKTAKRLSGEYPGALSRLLEARHPGAVALFLQGAAGSVRSTSPRPRENYRGIKDPAFAEVAMQADMLYEFVAQAEAGMKFEDTIDLSSALVKVALPAPDAHFFPEQRPWLLARILSIIPDWCLSRVANWVMLPRETVFQATRVNHAYLFMFPCDLSNRLGWELKRYVRRDHVFILGHSNDYSLGYVLAREEYDMGGMWPGLTFGERVQDYFGKRAGPFCIKVSWMLANMVREKGADDVFDYPAGDHPGTIPGKVETPLSP